MQTVSIVVPCRNEARHLAPFLDCVLSQKLPSDTELEVLVAEGCSTDASRDILSQFAVRHPSVLILDNPEGIVSTGLNRAIRAARGDVIVRMDVHARYADDYVAQCLSVLAESGADNVGGPARTRANGYFQSAIAGAYHSPFACGGARFHNVEFEGYVDTVTFGCWHKEIFGRIGHFDESLVRNQDDEFNLRLRRAGGRIYQSPRIRCWYEPRSSLATLFRQYWQYG
ncbi:MAG: glycosyltransferase family 2 protein, partial [Acidobacteriaceae bacterium]|nr:glycosyltransferase family 2 protein [Acidobacteriaceae bacterium]